jgi:glutamyl-Q tRNA(Asp) synthetase
MEDVDTARCRKEWADDILITLERFGFEWDGEVLVQSERGAFYKAALDQLENRRLVYRCTCSRREIADSATEGLDGPVYPGTCRHAARAGTHAAWRVVTNDQPIAFTDRIQGGITQSLESQVGDFVLRRRDALFAYQLAVVVDDAAQNITHVVRGADLLDSTPRQIWLQRLLGFPALLYGHVPIAVNERGQKLSKQTLARSIAEADMRILINAALVFLGQSQPQTDTPKAMLGEAIANWDQQAIPRTRYDPIPSNLSA